MSEKSTTAIVSGRMREDVQSLAGIQGIFYAGSHGFDICGPGFSLVQPEAVDGPFQDERKPGEEQVTG